jgi:hypothetical protein
MSIFDFDELVSNGKMIKSKGIIWIIEYFNNDKEKNNDGMNMDMDIDESKCSNVNIIEEENITNYNDSLTAKQFLQTVNFLQPSDSIINSTKLPLNWNGAIDSTFTYFRGIITLNTSILSIIALPSQIPPDFNYCCLGTRDNFQFFNIFIKHQDKVIYIPNIIKDGEIKDENWLLNSIDVSDKGFDAKEFEFKMETEQIITGKAANQLINRIFFKGEKIEELNSEEEENLVCLVNIEFNRSYLGADECS